MNYPVDNFEDKINEYYRSGIPLVDGYAPFWYISFVQISFEEVI